jgi:lysophospholipase L1-like esterase
MVIVLTGFASAGFFGCGSSDGGSGTGSGSTSYGGNAGGAGAGSGSGGGVETAGSGGSMAGTLGDGGTVGASGGSDGAAGGDGAGGRDSSDATGTGGASGGAGSSGMCVRGQVRPSEVVFIGDSFIALGNNIPNALDAIARAAGSLGQNESYRRNAVSGTLLGSGQIPSQYMNAVNASPVKVVLMDGGGNDCLHQNNPNPAYAAAVSLFQNMAKRNTEQVIYFFYPDPLGGYAGGTLQPCLDGLRPMIKSLCEGLTTPKCYFIDLRPGWKRADTTDGIHTTAEGGKFVADKVWATMQQNCIAQ